MSVSLTEVINAAGYEIDNLYDARWILATQKEYEALIEQAAEIVEAEEQREMEEAEIEYRKTFGDE